MVGEEGLTVLGGPTVCEDVQVWIQGRRPHLKDPLAHQLLEERCDPVVLRTAEKGTASVAKAVEHTRWRQCLSHEGSGTHKVEAVS